MCGKIGIKLVNGGFYDLVFADCRSVCFCDGIFPGSYLAHVWHIGCRTYFFLVSKPAFIWKRCRKDDDVPKKIQSAVFAISLPFSSGGPIGCGTSNGENPFQKIKTKLRIDALNGAETI